MDITHLKAFAKRASKEDLFDIIYYKHFPEDELVFFKDEVKARALETEFAEIIKMNDNHKNKIKETVKTLPKEQLFIIIDYNQYKFTEEELIPFRNEVKARGLEEELSAIVKAKEADAIEFKATVLDSSDDPMELLKNFNTYTEKKNPGIVRHVEEARTRKRKKTFLTNLILGVIIMVIGVVLTGVAHGDMIFIGAIVTGIVLIGRGITIYIKP